MTDNQRFVAAIVVMVGGTALFMLALSVSHSAVPASEPSNGAVFAETAAQTAMAAEHPPKSEVESPNAPQVPETPPSIDTQENGRYFVDSHGAVMSESETEAQLDQLRRKIQAMPDNGERAFSEGALKALETEWARIKAQGPIQRRPTSLASSRQSSNGHLPEHTKRRVFYDIVAAQDAGIGDVQAFLLVGKQYNLPHATLLGIVHEGVAKKWPMP